MADSALHARLLLGPQHPVRGFASSAAELDQHLAATRVALLRGEESMEQGKGANVMEGPLNALRTS